MNPIFLSKLLPNRTCARKARRPALLLLAGSAVIAGSMLSSCATSRGFGQDVEKVGDKIQHAATR